MPYKKAPRHAGHVRLFLSIPVPVDLSQATEPFQGDGFRPVPPGSWHLTVRFLGAAETAEVIAAMDGFTASPMGARFDGAGAFPDAKKARVVWVGVQADGLADVAADARGRLEGIGQEDRKAFMPHVTLGRCKRPRDVRAALRDVPLPRDGFRLDRVDLMASELTPEGPVYSVVRSWPL